MSQLILVAPAAFKGTLGPRRVADALAVGARRALPGAAVLQCPIADGGDGLLDAVLAPAALRERLSVTGPLGEPVSGELGWVDPETAIFESATACGIALLKPEQLDPLRATTRGVGELLWEAVERGAKTVVVGLGGTATVDGGTGAAGGLGVPRCDGCVASRGRRVAGAAGGVRRGVECRGSRHRARRCHHAAGRVEGRRPRPTAPEARGAGGCEAPLSGTGAPGGADGPARPRRPGDPPWGWCRGRSGRRSRVLRQSPAHRRRGMGARADRLRRRARQG